MTCGYSWQRFPLDLAWFTDCGRLRHFQFGSKHGVLLNPPLSTRSGDVLPAALASDDRSFAQLLYLQGLPADFDLPSFTVEGKKRAVGNGVPLPLGSVLAQLVDRDVYGVTQPAGVSVTAPGAKGVTEPASITVTPRGLNAVTDRSPFVVTCPGAECVTRRRSNFVTDQVTDSVTTRGRSAVTCQCGCGRVVVGRALYAGPACRKRAQRMRAGGLA